ncbi:hypothetical protein ACNUDN_06315 [Mycobacterium sp. smrl_JER01]|uniref:hypothetical protein n=1 Tax=Mycobacterium sp. smrl_JER01 TaxID=3402633 RepID=UPI003ACAE07E
MSFVKNAAAGAFLGGSLLFTAGLGMAHAQPAESPSDGQVGLSIGSVTLLESSSADTVAAAAAAICGATPADVSALATQVGTEGGTQTVCSGLPGGDLVVVQSVSTTPAETPAPAETAAPAETPAPAPEAPAEGTAPEAETGTGEGLGAPEGTGGADGGSVPLPSNNDR